MTTLSPESLAVDERLCLALYRASRAMTARYRPMLDGLGLTYPQYTVMSVLWEGGAVSVGRLGDRLDLDSSTLSPLLKRLETAGLIRRRRDGADERVVVVSLTSSGSRLRRNVRPITDAICAASGLDESDQAELVSTLRVLADRLAASE